MTATMLEEISLLTHLSFIEVATLLKTIQVLCSVGLLESVCRQLLSMFFLSTKILLLKVLYKNSAGSLFLGASAMGPQLFFIGCLNIYSKKKLMLKFRFQLAGHNFSGLLPKNDLVLYVLRIKFSP